MRNLLSLIPAFLLSVALVILGQAPEGAAPAFKGPDAVAANLVNTACAGCHSLDRVKNKVADKEGWTTTVARMKAAGATEEIFTDSALRLLHTHTQGVPRLINRLGDHALVFGFGIGEKIITAAAIAVVAAEMRREFE